MTSLFAELTAPTVTNPPSPNELYKPNSVTQRLLGAFYTPQSAADYIADWAVRYDDEHILEPSFGDGIFLRAIRTSACRKHLTSIRLSGVEIDREARSRALHESQDECEQLHVGDFLGVSPFSVQAIVGNPPYVRIRQLADAQKNTALDAAKSAMGMAMDPSGSLWMPFILHAMRFLATGGRMAFVLPYEFTYVRYARPLWLHLRDHFGSLRILRTHERLFPDLLQDVVVLLADSYGSCTDTIDYQAFERVDDLLNAHPIVNETLSVDDLLHGERVFISALLSNDLRQFLRTKVYDVTVPARELVTFNIGYVAGDKSFFHPNASEAQDYNLPTRSLIPSLTSTRAIKGAGLKTSNLDDTCVSNLFLPDPSLLTNGEHRYIRMGEDCQISSRYKCRVRDPWFVVPGTRIPDIVLSVFSERPLLLINDAEFLASNSLLCGYTYSTTPEEVTVSWYTSLTLLQCELEVHALGGGVMVMVPREAGNIRLPRQVQIDNGYVDRLDHLLQLGQPDHAYHYGDNNVLMEQLHFSENDIHLIRDGISVLSHWRTSARTSKR